MTVERGVERGPCLLDLRAAGRLRQIAACCGIGDVDVLAGFGEDRRDFGHEVHAAEDDVLRVSFGAIAGELERIPAKIGELNHLVALIVMSQNDEAVAQSRFSAPGAFLPRKGGGGDGIEDLHAQVESGDGMGDGAGGNEVHAGAGDGGDCSERHIARSFQRHAASREGDGLPQRLQVHVVQQDAVERRGDGQRCAQLGEGAHFDFDGQFGMRRAGAGHGGSEAAGAVNVIVFHHEHVEEGHAVILPAAHAHGVFIEHAIAGQRLAGVEDHGARCGDGVHEIARRRGNTRHPLQEVECRALPRQQRRARAADLGEELARGDFLSVADIRGESECGVHGAEDGFRYGQAGDDPRRFGDDAPDQRHGGVEGGLAGRIAGPDVLGEGQFDQRCGGSEELFA
ncbi:MAG: hypothetical protein BWY25_01033 [Chloroflexi bacterium ADurb.Bin222]|nr:MAG: hypothetical protein BWY25_01033 [Chloroflexi bacterium ADurb.Bin222]